MKEASCINCGKEVNLEHAHFFTAEGDVFCCEKCSNEYLSLEEENDETSLDDLDDEDPLKKGRKFKEDTRNYVQINDNFRFSSDNHCFILEKLNESHEITRGKYKGGTSETKWVEVGYFGELRQLVKYCITYFIRDAFGDLKEIYKRIEEMNIMIDEKIPLIRVKNGQCVIREENQSEGDK